MKYMPRPTVARLLAPLASLVFLVMLMGATQLAETITPFLLTDDSRSQRRTLQALPWTGKADLATFLATF